LPFAAAVEMVHTYSLIHDDLPAMDDDDYRRGKPTNHKVYGEATAILAGDGLLTLAFATIAQADLPHKTISKGVLALAQCAGVNGMVGGQALDIAENPTTLAELERIQSKKTGALIVAACQLGGIVAQGTPSQLEKITIYAQKLGRAFQIRDDILDELGDTETLGKPIGSDKGLQKHTFFTELGAEGAQAELEKLTRESIQAITSLQSPEFHIALATQLESREK
ncbi:MAG: polyprenyl synthetase family protein, partial [Eubacteriales bacterium]